MHPLHGDTSCCVTNGQEANRGNVSAGTRNERSIGAARLRRAIISLFAEWAGIYLANDAKWCTAVEGILEYLWTGKRLDYVTSEGETSLLYARQESERMDGAGDSLVRRVRPTVSVGSNGNFVPWNGGSCLDSWYWLAGIFMVIFWFQFRGLVFWWHLVTLL